MMLLADIATGNTDAADVLFLVALIVAAVAVVVFLATSVPDRIAGALVAAALGCVAFGFLLL